MARSLAASRTLVPGVAHDWVVHKKKRKVINGKVTWIKPKWVILAAHFMTDGAVIHAKGGTQVIDRCWAFIKNHIGNRTANIKRLRFAIACGLLSGEMIQSLS